MASIGCKHKGHRKLISKRRAVTLIELMVVTTIMGLLVTMMLPSMTRAREQARRTSCLANLKHIGVGLFTYATDYFEKGPPVMRPLGGISNRSFLQIGGDLVNLGRLWPTYIGEANVYRCLSAQKTDLGGTIEQLGTPYPVAGNYTYSIQIPANESPRIGATRHLALASDNFVSWRHQDGHGAYTHKVGYNVLYTDGSCGWYADPKGEIAKRGVEWDREGDEFTYQSIYDPTAEIPASSYGSAMDIFRVWYAFCYNKPVEFTE
jgi:prepilin-type N-terminal cleavage/methylation domain-containing protein